MGAGGALAFPYAGPRVPHAVLEINQRCNISCNACYKSKSAYTKPFRRVVAELDALCACRDLSTVTIAGGEPTLHPELPAIIAHCAGRGLSVQLISNCVELPETLLESCRRAGLRDILIHVDASQNRPDVTPGASEAELLPLREAIVGRIARHGINCSVALTVYRSTLDQVAGVVAWMIAHPDVKRMVLFCCGDIEGTLRRFAGGRVLETTYPAAERHDPEEAAAAPEPLASQEVGTADLASVFARLGLQACMYNGSNRSDEERRWLVFAAVLRQGPTGSREVYLLPPSYGRVLRFAHALASLRLGRRPGPAGGLPGFTRATRAEGRAASARENRT